MKALGKLVKVQGEAAVFVPVRPGQRLKLFEKDGRSQARMAEEARRQKFYGHYSLEQIRSIVGAYYGVGREDMLCSWRAPRVCRPRMVAMTLCREYTKCSTPRIGQFFGGRDHTTVLNGIRRVQQLASDHAEWREDLAILRRTLSAIQGQKAIVGQLSTGELVWEVSATNKTDLAA